MCKGQGGESSLFSFLLRYFESYKPTIVAFSSNRIYFLLLVHESNGFLFGFFFCCTSGGRFLFYLKKMKFKWFINASYCSLNQDTYFLGDILSFHLHARIPAHNSLKAKSGSLHMNSLKAKLKK